MKKLLVMIIAAFVIAINGFAIADSINVSNLPLEELLELKKSVDEAIFNNDQMNESVLFPGYYIVGKNIDPGTYVLYCVEEYGSKACMLTYATEQDYEDRHNSDRVYVGEKEYRQYDISDAYAVIIYNGTLLITKR